MHKHMILFYVLLFWFLCWNIWCHFDLFTIIWYYILCFCYRFSVFCVYLTYFDWLFVLEPSPYLDYFVLQFVKKYMFFCVVVLLKYWEYMCFCLTFMSVLMMQTALSMSVMCYKSELETFKTFVFEYIMCIKPTMIMNLFIFDCKE